MKLKLIFPTFTVSSLRVEVGFAGKATNINLKATADFALSYSKGGPCLINPREWPSGLRDQMLCGTNSPRVWSTRPRVRCPTGSFPGNHQETRRNFPGVGMSRAGAAFTNHPSGIPRRIRYTMFGEGSDGQTTLQGGRTTSSSGRTTS